MSDDWFSSTTQGVVVPVASRTPWLWDSRKLKFDRFGRTVGLWWSLVCWFVVFLFFFFDVVGLLSYIELCGDDNFVGIFNCIYIYTSFILFVKAVFPPEKNTDPACFNFFFEKLFHTKDVVAECGHRLLEGVCVPPSTVQIFLLLKRKSGRRIPTVSWLP